MPKEITFYVILGKKRDPSEICANPNLRNRTHITKKPSYVYLFIVLTTFSLWRKLTGQKLPNLT